MTIREEVLRRLRRGDPLEEIRRSTTSQSQFYKALEEYWAEAKEVTLEIQEKLRHAKGELGQTRAELQQTSLERAHKIYWGGTVYFRWGMMMPSQTDIRG